MLQINNNVTENKNVFSNKHQTRSGKLSVHQRGQILKYLHLRYHIKTTEEQMSKSTKKRKKQRKKKKNLSRKKQNKNYTELSLQTPCKQNEWNKHQPRILYPTKLSIKSGGKRPSQTKTEKTENLLICLARNVKTSSSDRNYILVRNMDYRKKWWA